MSKGSRGRGPAPADEADDVPTINVKVPEDRRVSINPDSARALAAAQEASGFPVSPDVQAAIDAAGGSLAQVQDTSSADGGDGQTQE